jgi:cytochrome c oxidase subunit 1
MHFLGLSGNPRRYAQLTDDFLQALIPLHQFITIAALITGAAQFVFLFNLFRSMYKGKVAPPNPWHATTLEWTLPSPTPADNFSGQSQVVYHGPYEYGENSQGDDYVMQNDPPEVQVLGSEKVRT